MKAVVFSAREVRCPRKHVMVPIVSFSQPAPDERMIRSAPLHASEDSVPPLQKIPPLSSMESNVTASSATSPLMTFLSGGDQDPPLLSSTSPSSQKTLENILLESGWRVDGDCKRLLALFQASLESVLFDKALYNS